EKVRCSPLHKVNRAATETSSHHPGSDNVLHARCLLDEKVEFLATYFVQVGKPGMSLEHLLTKRRKVILLQIFSRLLDTDYLIDDIPTTLKYFTCHGVLVFL